VVRISDQEPASEGRRGAQRERRQEDGGGSRPFGYKIIRHDLGEELEPAEKELIEEAASRVLRGESLRSIAMDWNERGVKAVGGGKWQGSMLRRVLMSPRIAGLKEHCREIVGEAKCQRSSTVPPMIDWSDC
jgi:site-specific DNA recombinase